MSRLKMLRVQRLIEKTFPEDPESWSESLAPPEGRWFTAMGNVYLDSINKVSGMYSIRAATEQYFYYVRAGFRLYTPIDCTKLKTFHFFHAVDPEKCDGICWFSFLDVNDNMATIDFGTAPGIWETKHFDVSPTSPLWSRVAPGFDFTKVKTIHISANLRNHTGNEWVDRPYFTYEVVRPILTITSKPTGKHYTINGVSGYTPARYMLEPNVSYRVCIDPQGFLQWEDGTTDPCRTISLGEGEEKTVTAYYVGVPPPFPEPPPVPWFWLCPYFYGLATVIYATRFP